MNSKGIDCLGDNGICIPVSTHLVKTVKKKTRADVIRSMNDEELAKNRIDRIDMYTKSDSKEYIGDFAGIANSEEEAIQKELEWLHSEAE